MRKNPALPEVTDQDKLERSELLRRTPKGGYAWKCSYCGFYASSQSVKGKLVCHRHGGATKATRDPIKRMQALEAGETPPRPPGRPMKSGFYTTGETIPVDTIVEEYKAQGLNPDDTDDDMLYLRAYLAELKHLKPSVDTLKDELESLVDALEPLRRIVLSGANVMTLDELMAELPAMRELGQRFDSAERLFKQLALFTQGLEARHSNLVMMAKHRAETRFKNKTSEELVIFTAFLNRLNSLLSKTLPPEVYRGLQKRFERNLSEVPTRLIEYPTVTVAAAKT